MQLFASISGFLSCSVVPHVRAVCCFPADPRSWLAHLTHNPHILTDSQPQVSFSNVKIKAEFLKIPCSADLPS